MDKIQKRLLEEVADLHEIPAGAYNIRANGQMTARNTTANINIVSKEGKSGCKTVFDIAPTYLSAKSGDELRASLL